MQWVGATSRAHRLAEYFRLWVEKNETLLKSEEFGPECYFNVWTKAYLMQIVLLAYLALQDLQ